MRTKYNDIAKANPAYRKQRRHNQKQTRKMMSRLLSLLRKILGEIRRQIRFHADMKLLSDKELTILEIVIKAYRQQKSHSSGGDARKSIPNRIVSISKPHVRPISDSTRQGDQDS